MIDPRRDPPLVAIVGPTATGKTALSVELARRLDAEVVNADAFQLYRGMDIGTAKPTPAERDGIPHHILDVLEIHDDASVAQYQHLAAAALEEILGRGRRAVLVGGSGLYVRAVLDGLEIPPTDPQVRSRLEVELAEAGAPALHARLAARDPAAAAVILATNGRRVVRALEVNEITGRPFRATLPDGAYARPAVQIGLQVPRGELDARIAARVGRMWQDGLVEEVRGLEAGGLRGTRTASRALGYAQVLRLLAGELTQEQAMTDTVAATRRFARRQESWFRRDHRVVWLPSDAPDLADRATGLFDTVTREIPFTKGHGTQNDFVLLLDPEGELELSPQTVAALCDRHSGFATDGLIRVVRSAALPDGKELCDVAEWFMDYRNADGSAAQMCGNGTRVFAVYLERAGLVRLDDGTPVPIGTRAGVKHVRREGELFVTDLGPWVLVGGAEAAAAGSDSTVEIATIPLGAPGTPLPGLGVDLGNPHTVVALPDAEQLAGADLRSAPVVLPAPVEGTNVEVVVPLHDASSRVGHLAMRVHERGVGETRSCGTGVVAAAIAARVWGGADAPHVWTVDVPGGRLRVTLPEGDLLRGSTAELAGAAVLGVEGTLHALP